MTQMKVIEGAIISGDLTQKEFKAYIDKYAKSDRIKGVRQCTACTIRSGRNLPAS
ncbi:MAG: hypothetical protein ACLS54_05520 [Anaerostipes hadrus]